ncbi:hypothetical protein O9Z70_06490 [Devosia sp. YIM 151766]|uniref:hypothetical protein n=1 Tax=Devosia sp. YIM 151766 TaxID=3017325 RepID=UPI00255C970B|nr:hypothetical protein [Devosia sp. YIM 151766]WIY54165.1 hypothetical protein O9Z70_06490 [Devosia sp. YIM 151766]
MAVVFQVIDLRTDVIGAAVEVQNATSPEDAARQVLGIDVFRSGNKRDLVARVYWQQMSGPTNMVRLYSKAVER